MAIETIPETHRDVASSALAEAFGSGKEALVQPVLGGASGALTYRIEVNKKSYLMRLETRRGPLRNPHQYTCMKIAADAEVAPALRYADDTAGVTDIAILTENFARTPELEQALVEAWLGRHPDRSGRARLRLMRKLTRLYYAGILLATATGGEPIKDLAAPTEAEFRTMVTSGQIQPGSVEAKKLLARMMLAGFLEGTQTGAFEAALSEARGE